MKSRYFNNCEVKECLFKWIVGNRSRREGYATMELHDRVSNIKTKRDLGQFVRALRADLPTNPERWENPTLDRFLEAMEAWIADMEGYYKNRGQAPADPPTWKTFGDILIAASMYEWQPT